MSQRILEIASESKNKQLQLRSYIIHMFYLSNVRWNAKTLAEDCGNALVIWKESEKVIFYEFSVNFLFNFSFHSMKLQLEEI